MKKFLIFFIWFLSLILISLYVHENPEFIEKIKEKFKDDRIIVFEPEEGNIERSLGNSFILEFSEAISFSGRTSFIIHDEKFLNFDKNNLIIYFQNGNFLKNLKIKKIDLPKNFTRIRNGGIKTVFIYKDKQFALLSSLYKGCFYASIVLIDIKKEIFKTKCLPTKKIDYNGLGSSHIHHGEKIILSIGTPEQASSAIRKLAQDKISFFGKIIEIDKKELDKVIEGSKNEIAPTIYTMGHRNPQGITKIEDSFFSVEHGPKGGDEFK